MLYWIERIALKLKQLISYILQLYFWKFYPRGTKFLYNIALWWRVGGPFKFLALNYKTMVYYDCEWGMWRLGLDGDCRRRAQDEEAMAHSLASAERIG